MRKIAGKRATFDLPPSLLADAANLAQREGHRLKRIIAAALLMYLEADRPNQLGRYYRVYEEHPLSGSNQ